MIRTINIVRNRCIVKQAKIHASMTKCLLAIRLVTFNVGAYCHPDVGKCPAFLPLLVAVNRPQTDFPEKKLAQGSDSKHPVDGVRCGSESELWTPDQIVPGNTPH